MAGEKVIYTAGSRAMAVLEAFTHLGPVRPADYVIRRAEIPDAVRILYPNEHPARIDGFKWALSDPVLSRTLGSQWVATRETAVLAVPSVLVPDEFNFLLNPAHPQFTRISVHNPEPYQFDERLWKAAAGPFNLD